MRQKGYVPLLIVIILALIGVIGYLVYSNTKLKDTSQRPIETPSSIATNTPTQDMRTTTPTAEPTKSWKTYSNTEYGFLIKYPTGWTEKPTAGGIPGTSNISQLIVLETNYRLPATFEMQYVYFDLTTFDFDGKTIQEWVEDMKLKGQVNAKIKRTFTINDYVFFEIEGLGSMYETKEYFVKVNDKYLNFGLEPFPAELSQELSNLEATFMQVLSTFKFPK